jgi:hypothetical protein
VYCECKEKRKTKSQTNYDVFYVCAKSKGGCGKEITELRSTDSIITKSEQEILLLASQTNTVITALTFVDTTFDYCEIVYRLKEANTGNVRIGTLYLYVTSNRTDVMLYDLYTETDDTGIEFDAMIDGANVDIRYSSRANGATMYYDNKNDSVRLNI